MKRQTAADAAMTAAILFLGASLFFTGGALLRSRTTGLTPSTPLELTEIIGAAAAGIGIAVTLWWISALAFAFVSGLASLSGRPRLAARAEAWSPAYMRRLVALVLGLNLIAAPMAMAAPGSSGSIDPHWRSGTVAQAPLHTGTGATIPDTAKGHGSPSVNPVWTPQAPVVEPGPLAHRDSRTSAKKEVPAHDPVGEGVVVRGGDSLWSIVATALGPYASDVEVSQAWPQWYQANRSIIGNDPNVILAGQVLHAPGGQS